MGLTRNQPTGLFFVKVLGQFRAGRGNRTLHIRAPNQDWKIANVGLVFLLEVDMKPVGGDGAIGEAWPCPVTFALHDCKEAFAEFVTGHKQIVSRA